MSTGQTAATGVTGCILAGGRGSRLGGLDKGLVELAGRALIAHVVARLAPQVEQVLISANRNVARYRDHAAEVVVDDDGGFAGPLAGMAAALARCRTPSAIFVPCDSPFLPLDLVARLRAARDATAGTIAVVRTGTRTQPVFALVGSALLDDLRAYLAAGGRKIDAWYARHTPVYADFPADDDAFMNVNTEADLAQATARIAAP